MELSNISAKMKLWNWSNLTLTPIVGIHKVRLKEVKACIKSHSGCDFMVEHGEIILLK